MPSKRVGIDIQANVTGSAAVQQLIQQLQQLNSLISPVAGRDWIGPGGVKGMIATAGQMSPPVAQQYLQSAINVGEEEALRLGITKTQSQVEASMPTAAVGAMPLLQRAPNIAYGGQVVTPGLNIQPTWSGGGKTLIPPGVGAGPVIPAAQRLESWELETNAMRAGWAAQSGLRREYGGWMSPVAGNVGWVVDSSGRVSLTGKSIDLTNIDDAIRRTPQRSIESAAKSAARDRGAGNQMLYGLMFQAFFGVLFGGMQEYLQSMQTGQRPLGGSGLMAMAPAIMNLAGMGVGLAFGNPMLAVGLGFAGQLGGQVVQSVAEGNIRYGQARTRYGRAYGSGAADLAMPEGWLPAFSYNKNGYTGLFDMSASFAPMAFSRGIYDPRATDRLANRVRGIYGRDDEQDAAKRLMRYENNPFTRDLFLGDDLKAPEYSGAGAVAAYMEYGYAGFADYTSWTKTSQTYAAPTIAPIMAAQRRAAVAGAWAPAISARMQFAMASGSDAMFNRGFAQSLWMINEQTAPIHTAMNQLAQNWTPAAGNEYSKLQAQLATYQSQMMDLIMMRSGQPLPPELSFQITGGETALRLQTTLGNRWWRYADKLGISYNDVPDNARATARKLIELYGEAISTYQDRYSQTVGSLLQQKNVGAIDEDEYLVGKRTAAKEFQENAAPFRSSIMNLIAELEERWMDRLVSSTWGSSGRLIGVMRGFNYMGASDALASRGFGPNRRLGGRSVFDYSSDTLMNLSDVESGRGGMVAEALGGGVQVHINVGGIMPEHWLSAFKRDLEGWVRERVQSATKGDF